MGVSWDLRHNRNDLKTGESIMTNIIKIENVYKTYKMGQADVQVLKGVDFCVEAGEFVAIVGASGSGKSTLLHICGALDSPDEGTVTYKDESIKDMTKKKINEYRNKQVGFVFQFYHLIDELNVLENVMLPAMIGKNVPKWLAKKAEVKQKAIQLLEKLKMDHRIKHNPYQLSGGERQRAAIARALINEPQLLLADEPTGNLDRKTGNGILEVFEKLNQNGQTIVMVTHDENVAMRTNRRAKLVNGRIQNV